MRNIKEYEEYKNMRNIICLAFESGLSSKSESFFQTQFFPLGFFKINATGFFIFCYA